MKLPYQQINGNNGAKNAEAVRKQYVSKENNQIKD